MTIKRPTSKQEWKSEHVGYQLDKAQARIDEIENAGGIVFVTADYTYAMSGAREWMGWEIHYIEGKDN